MAGKSKRIAKDVLMDLYLVQFKTMEQIGAICNCNRRTVQTWLEQYNIPKIKNHYPKGKHPNYKGYNEISGETFAKIQESGRVRDLEFNLTIEYLWELFEKQNRKCALTNLEIHFPGVGRTNRNTGTASLDRIESNKGYIIGNVQWVHKTINRMKGNLIQSEFIRFCKEVAKHKG